MGDDASPSDGEGSAGAEVVLHVDDQKRVRVLNGYAHRSAF